MRLFRRSQSERELSDYRSVTTAVRARRATREEKPEEWAAADELRDTARSYAPEDRLKTVSDEVRQYQHNCEGMPRTWEDSPLEDHAFSRMILRVMLTVAAGFGVLVAVLSAYR